MFETIIGLEIHVELDTKSKIFCSCSTKFGSEPNENTCPVCTGLPGSLPVLNEEVVDLAMQAGLSLNCKINRMNKADRKNYFYPDSPKAYQISQFDIPICDGGYVDYEIEGKTQRCTLTRIHIEEDAGKLIHMEHEPVTLVDYNRTGVPLIEIVSEPDLRSPAEAVAFLKALKLILEYSEVSDCKMEQGSLRCDANISMREIGSDVLNTRVEIKNINSFKEVEKALMKEEKRQRELYTYNEQHKIVQETRKWDAAKGRTVPMRSKEEAHDYRYFPEPDLPLVIIADSEVEEIKNNLHELPVDKRDRFIAEYKLSEQDVAILIEEKKLAEFFEATVEFGASAKDASNWILVELLRIMKETDGDDVPVKAEDLAELIKMLKSGDINRGAAKEVLEEMAATEKSPATIIDEKGLKQVSDSGAIEGIIDGILAANPQAIEDYLAGKQQSFGFLMGQSMKASKGQGNPKVVKEILTEKLKSL